MKKLILSILFLVGAATIGLALTNEFGLADFVDLSKFATGAKFRPGRDCPVEMDNQCYGCMTVTNAVADFELCGCGLLWCDTSGNTINLHGFIGGTNGAPLKIVKIAQTNSLIIKHNSTSGTERIITPNSADITFTNWGGATLVFRSANTNWYVINYSNE